MAIKNNSSHICKTKHESWTFMKLLMSPTYSTYLTPICNLKPKHHLDILNVDFKEKFQHLRHIRWILTCHCGTFHYLCVGCLHSWNLKKCTHMTKASDLLSYFRPPLHYGEGMTIEILRALKTHPKVIPWKFNNHLGLGLSSQV